MCLDPHQSFTTKHLADASYRRSERVAFSLASWKRWDTYRDLVYESFPKALHQLCKAEVIVSPAREMRKLSLAGDGAMPELKPGLSGIKLGLSPGWPANLHDTSHVHR